MKDKIAINVDELLLPLRRARFFVVRLFDLNRIIFSCLFLSRQKQGDAIIDLTRPERFRLFFERAGGAFLKLGQILAMRQDLLPPSYTEELLGLLSQVPEESWEVVEKVFMEEMGVPPAVFFAEIGKRPIAAASIGQVYRATMHDGAVVAVKIARPGIEEIFENDFVLAAFLGEIIGIFTFMKALPIQDVVAEFIASTRAELDFRNEAKNAALLLEHSEHHQGVVIPRPYLDITTKRVLVIEFLEDVLTAEKALRELRLHGDIYREELETKGMDLQELSYRFMVDITRQFFIDGFFHADPHPGNVFFLPGNKVGFFDFGLVGHASHYRPLASRIMYAMAHRDIYGMSKTFLELAKSSFEEELALYRKSGKALDQRYDAVMLKIEEIMIDNFALDLQATLLPWYEAIDKEQSGPLSGQELYAKSASVMLSKVILMSRNYDIVLPREIVLLVRSLSISDMVALRLYPGFDMMKALQRFFHEYSLASIAEIVAAQEHARPLATEDIPITVLDQSFEGIQELRLRDEERLQVAKERLAEIIDYYSEQYPEVRALLKN